MLGLTGSFRSTPDVVAAVNVVGSSLLGDYRPLSVGKPPADDHAEGEPRIELLLTQAKGWGEDEDGTLIETRRHRYAAEPDRRGEGPGAAPPRARRGGRRARLDGAAAAGVHARRRLRRGAGAGRARPLRRRRARLLVLPAGDRRDRPALAASPTRSTTSRCSARSPRPPARSARTGSGSCAGSPAGGTSGRRSSSSPPPREDGDADASPQPEAEPIPSCEKRIAEQRLWEDRLPEADRERLTGFHDTLVGLRSTAALLPLDDLVERVLEGFGYDLAALLMDDGLRRTANLLKLVRIAGEYEAHEGRDLRGFLEQAATRAAMSDREAEAAVAAEDHAGVRVMTVHAAKGLEFDCVAVADLGRKLAGGGQPPLLRLAFDDGGPREDGEAPAPRIGLRLARAGRPVARRPRLQADQRRGGRRRRRGVRAARLRRREPRPRSASSSAARSTRRRTSSPPEAPQRRLSAIACLLPGPRRQRRGRSDRDRAGPRGARRSESTTGDRPSRRRGSASA